MKTTISFLKNWVIAGILLVAPIVSCKKALDTEPYSDFTSANFFSNVDEAYMATLGVYQIMKEPETYGWYIPMVYDVDSDIQTISAGTTPDWRSIPHYLGIPETGFFYETWSAFYSGIDRANVVIEKIPQMSQYKSGNATQKAELNRLLGEARFLRGFYYFELVRLWGDIPFKTKASQTGDDLKLGLTNRSEIYAKIIKDMQEASNALPAGLATDERITKWGAKAMLARVALFAGGYSLSANGTVTRPGNYLDYYRIAQTQINDVVGANIYKLNPSYSQVFKNQSAQIPEPTENLFEASFYTPTATTTNESSIGSFNAPRTVAGVYGNTLNRCFVPKSFQTSFQSGDLRRDFSVARYSLDADGNRIALLTGRLDEQWTPGKWSREYQLNSPLERTYTNINYVMMRYSDLLLMRAEVENELNNGPNAVAYDAINQVRRRAYGLALSGGRIDVTLNNGGSGYTASTFIKITGGGGKDASAVATVASGRVTAITMLDQGSGYTSVPAVTFTGAGTGAAATARLVPYAAQNQADLASGLSKAAFLTAIQDERAWELCFEGTRRADLIRWNILGDKLASTQAALRTIRPNYAYVAGDNFVKNKHELYPFPQNETDVNKSITRQNPGY